MSGAPHACIPSHDPFSHSKEHRLLVDFLPEVNSLRIGTVPEVLSLLAQDVRLFFVAGRHPIRFCFKGIGHPIIDSHFMQRIPFFHGTDHTRIAWAYSNA